MNPFDELFPENMTDETVESLFVSDMTSIDDVLTENHHIVWGSRGAGKSMLFRYIWAKNPKTFTELAHTDPYNNHISVYFQMSRNMLNAKEFSILFEEKVSESEAMSLSEHMLNMFVTQAIIVTLRKIEGFPLDKAKYISQRIVSAILDYRIMNTIDQVNKREPDIFEKDPFEWLHKITQYEIYLASNYLRDHKRSKEYAGSYTGYYDYLFPVFKILQNSLGESYSFYLLIDDAGYLHPFQQKILNGWLAHRDHDLLSIKISATRNDYLCFTTPDSFTLDPTHDYSETELDVIYYGREEYENRIQEIVNKRFLRAGLPPIPVSSFFPEDEVQVALVKTCETQLMEEYEDYSKTKKIEWSVFKSRYLLPRVFQAINEKKGMSYSYSGFKNLVNLSSGIVRIFIQMCSEMWTAAQKLLILEGEGQKNINDGLKFIPPKIQHDAAYKYAKDYLKRLTGIYKDGLIVGQSFYFSKPRIGYEIVYKVENLLRSLGFYFRNRLLNPKLSEQLMMAFSIRNPEKLSTEARMVLRIATMHSYLQATTNSRKDSGIREECYIMSRCLAPIFNLCAGALKGRVIFSAEDVELAINDTNAFLSKKAPKSRTSNQEISHVLDGQLMLDLTDEIEIDEDI